MRRNIGKLLGFILGYAFGGNIYGGVVGLVVGHLYDSRRASYSGYSHRGYETEDLPFPDGLTDGLQQSTFTIGVIVLGAKMAKTDGRVSREEIAAFRRIFRIPDSQIDKIGKLFDSARKSADGYEPYAARLAHVFLHKPAVLEEILTGLFLVAIADSIYPSPAETAFLRRVATIFGFNETDFYRIAARSGIHFRERTKTATSEDSYMVLGLPQNASDTDIKKTYRALIRKHHPDKLVAQGMPPEMIAQATEKMKRINAAYDSVCKARGIK